MVVVDGCPSVSFGCEVCKEGSNRQILDSKNTMYECMMSLASHTQSRGIATNSSLLVLGKEKIELVEGSSRPRWQRQKATTTPKEIQMLVTCSVFA